MVIAIILIIVGVISSTLVIYGYGMSGGNTEITIAFLMVAIALIIIGTVLAFSRLLDRAVNPLIDEINRGIEDDIQDIKEHRITNTIWMIIIVGIAALIFSFFVLRFHKVEAMWGSIPVIIPTFIGVKILAWYIPRTRWFQSEIYTPLWIFLIPTVGFFLTIWLGLARTENVGIIVTSRQESIYCPYNQYTGAILQEASNIGDLGFELDIPDCDGDACAVCGNRVNHPYMRPGDRLSHDPSLLVVKRLNPTRYYGVDPIP